MTNQVNNTKTNADAIEFFINGEAYYAELGETIIEAADRYGLEIPRLCYSPHYRPDGNCRACMVEVEGERVLAPSCCRKVSAGMQVDTANERVIHSQNMVLELLLTDIANAKYTLDENSELISWCKKRGIEFTQPRFAPRPKIAADLTHSSIAVQLDACIQCTRCVRACREAQGNDVIGFAGRGENARIVFDLEQELLDSTCVACGECVQACPTGALMPADQVGLVKIDKEVDSVCPYCGVGCQLRYHISDNKIAYVTGNQGPANQGRLCVKGRYGYDYINHPHRLRHVLIRKPDVPKNPDKLFDPDQWQDYYDEVSWDEALVRVCEGFSKIKDESGARALAGFGSAKGSNEEAYLFQKLIRTVFGTNNVDHCTRLCHASSVAALLEGIGSGAVSNPVSDIKYAEVAIIIGANPVENHPVAATWIKNAAREGTKLIVIDPRKNGLAPFAHRFLQEKPDSDVALLNAMIHTIIEEDLVDQEFIAKNVNGFAEVVQSVAGQSPEAMEKVCGIDAQTIRYCARIFAQAKSSMILWGMGISQHTHGTDNVRSLIALSMITGQIGKLGSGLHPLRGQNNVQGASDAGLIPMMLPDYAKVANSTNREKFSAYWEIHGKDANLDPEPGLTVVEIVNAIYENKIRGLYIMGENPAMSDPDAAHARTALAKLDLLVVQDIFLTETAMLADIILPASALPEKSGTFTNTDRIVQLAQRAVQIPVGARDDLWIIQQIAKGMGHDWEYQGDYHGVAQVFDEMRRCMPNLAGITWQRLQAEHSVTYPCKQEGDPGDPVVFQDGFPTADNKAQLFATAPTAAAELPDDEYPLILITGRELEHWHTGAMTRRASKLDAIAPTATVSINPEMASAYDLSAGDVATVQSRRGEICLQVKIDPQTPKNSVFIPFAYYEAAANMLTNPKLDPYGKIPEFKFCAVRLHKGGKISQLLSYGGGGLSADLHVS